MPGPRRCCFAAQKRRSRTTTVGGTPPDCLHNGPSPGTPYAWVRGGEPDDEDGSLRMPEERPPAAFAFRCARDVVAEHAHAPRWRVGVLPGRASRWARV